jgi:hypothetical protein
LAYHLVTSRIANSKCIEDFVGPFDERMQQMNVLLNLISEQQLISDRAKVVAFREKDRDALRHAIHEEIGRKDWEAALALANDMESIFGYKEESARLRGEIEHKRDEIYRKQVADAVAGVDRFIRTEQWQEAHLEAKNVMAQFPNDAHVQNLPNEIENRRQAHKKQLRDSLQEATSRNDIDGSIEILKKLDTYLTPAEAEELQEVAHHVLKERLAALRTQFVLAAQDNNWAEAGRLADLINRDFSKTRLAHEVREVMEKQKTAGAAAAVPAGA